MYTPLWSDRILDEMTRNLIAHRLTDAQASSINQAMRSAFEEAEVDASEIARLEPSMTNEAKDRHVLAAAVAADSELVVTFNLDDFPPEAWEPVGVEAVHPDDFLLDLHDLAGKQCVPPLSSRPPTFTRPGRSDNSSTRWLPPASLASSKPSAVRPNVASVLRPHEGCRYRHDQFRGLARKRTRGDRSWGHVPGLPSRIRAPRDR